MKKLKLITSLSTLTALTAVAPIVVTGCSKTNEGEGYRIDAAWKDGKNTLSLSGNDTIQFSMFDLYNKGIKAPDNSCKIDTSSFKITKDTNEYSLDIKWIKEEGKDPVPEKDLGETGHGKGIGLTGDLPFYGTQTVAGDQDKFMVGGLSPDVILMPNAMTLRLIKDTDVTEGTVSLPEQGEYTITANILGTWSGAPTDPICQFTTTFKVVA